MPPAGQQRPRAAAARQPAARHRAPGLHQRCLAMCVLLVPGLALLAGAMPGAGSSHEQDLRAEMLSYCDGLKDLYAAIKDDLSPWAETGINRTLMASSISKFSTRARNKGITLAFKDGIAYVVDAQLAGPVGHHASAFFAYMQVMLDLQRVFGRLIPDVEFVIATSDRPMVRLASPGQPLPVFRFCSSAVHADIQVPIFHFTTKHYTQKMLGVIPDINKQYPWSKKKEVLFGRFANYVRFVDPNEPSLHRTGANNTSICVVETNSTAVCKVRQHMFVWAKEYPELIDVKSAPRLPMIKHAQYKYLLHMDGQALSSRIDLLMPLNSLIFKEESGYTTFYHHLLKPKVHYIPVWRHSPEDMLEALAWARDHDDQARHIASMAQRFATKYLNKRARMCYWYTLLVEFSKLLKYKVSPVHEVQELLDQEKKAKQKNKGKDKVQPRSPEAAAGRKNPTWSPLPEDAFGRIGRWKTVAEYLQDVPMHFEGGRWWNNKTEEF